MNETGTEHSEPRWYNRGIGIFCGGFLGFCFAVILAVAIGGFTTLQVISMLAGGLASGVLIGYIFPRATETVWWILSLFSCF
jgi:hypothetical protein